ncbi:MAG: CBS domain-containing protein [Ectothiorhodospiraceae bacterium]|jgi:CBS domain-containing protein
MYEFLQYQVADVMTRQPVTVEPETSLAELEALFARHDFNGVPVTDKDARLVGLATKFDLLKAFTFSTGSKIPRYDEIMRQPVFSVMTREPVTVAPELPLTRVLQKMLEMRNKSFPVEENGRLVGMIAREDLLAGLRRSTGHV